MVVETKPLAEITLDALRILYREMGVVNTVRFLSQFTTGFGDYTAERECLFADLTVDDIVSEIEQSRSQARHEPPQEPPSR
ncbi:MAG: hypothetical protein ACUVXG_12525 [Anaerolineae bacterium]